MKKIIAVALSLTFALLALAVLPPFTSAHRDVNRKALDTVDVPINQSRHLAFSVTAQGETTAANSADYYTLDVSNASASPTAPDSGYLNGVCNGVLKRNGGPLYLMWMVSLTSRFQYDNFQSARRVSLSGMARGWAPWGATYPVISWGASGQSWLDSSITTDFVDATSVWFAGIDEEMDSEGNCYVSITVYPEY